MGWFNYYGLAIIAIIMIPNIIFAVKCKDKFANLYINATVEVLEQIGRYGCMILMVFNIPHTYFNFWFDNALTVYLAVNGCLCVAYLVCWIVFWRKNGIARALTLSILPSLVFIFSGVMILSIPLIVVAVIFTVNHILLSCKNIAIHNKDKTAN